MCSHCSFLLVVKSLEQVVITLLLETLRFKTATSDADWAEILSHIISCMNLVQFEEVEIRIFLVEKISISYHFLRRNIISHGLKCMTFYLMRKNMQFELSNRARTTSKPPVGSQLFICWVNYYELHCIIHSRRHHVAILNRKVFTKLMTVADLLQVVPCKTNHTSC